MAPAHPHATGVAVYPALFLLKSKKKKQHLSYDFLLKLASTKIFSKSELTF